MGCLAKFTELHYSKDVNPILDFASIFYGFGAGFKNWLYDSGVLKPAKVDAFVVSVGNITTGGVGKTPVVAEIAKHLGEKTAIISRGYGGKGKWAKGLNIVTPDSIGAADEPLWLAQNLASAVIITCKDRVKAARYAVEQLGVKNIVLDDGFQHRRLHRDVDIVLADSRMMFGNAKLLPAGPLREDLRNLARADKLLKVSKTGDSADVRMMPDGVYNIKTGTPLKSGSAVTAICAIGQPGSFYDLLTDFKIKHTVTFDDHHNYEFKDVSNIKGTIVTTEKDAVKLQKFGLDNIYALKLKTVMDLSWLGG